MNKSRSGIVLIVGGIAAIIIGIMVRSNAAESARSECTVDGMVDAMMGSRSTRSCSDLAASSGEIAGYFLIGGGILAVIVGIAVYALTRKPPVQPSRTTTSSSERDGNGKSTTERLTDLAKLRDAGFVTDEEYKERRERILGDV